MASDKKLSDSIVTEIETLIEDKRFDSAVGVIKKNRAYLTGGSDWALGARLYFLHAIILYETGQYLKSLIKMKVCLRLALRMNLDSLYADAKLWLGRLLIRLGRTEDAAEELTESYVFYRRIKQYESIQRPLSSLAQIHFSKGNLRRACEVLKLALSYEVKYSTQEKTDIDRRNLARVHVLAGDFRGALSVLDSTDESCSDSWGVADGERVRGYAYLLQLNLELAEECLKRSQGLFAKSGSARDVAVCTEYLGLLEYYRGNYRKACECYEEVLGAPEPTASAVAQTLRMLTDTYIAERKFGRAMVTAQKAENAINKVGERIELGALYRAYGQIYTSRGETETACEYFRKSIELLKQTGAQYEHALSHLACGESSSYEPKERAQHLEVARMLFAEMGVDRRVEEVDRIIYGVKPICAPNVVTRDSQDNGEPIIVAVNPGMRGLLGYAGQIAQSDMNVLLTGETGTGKDLFARYIHCRSGREGRFVPLNVAAIPNEMVEAELFGFVEGAFTGAKKSKQGLLETAEGGTICLNEIADATPEFQAKLLEVLETRCIRRLGETKARHIDFRLIAACNRDLERMIRENRFRRDLYHRLNDVSIELPSLNRRIDEIPALVEWFLFNSGNGIKISNDGADAVERLGVIMAAREYPGNVRELRAKVNELKFSSHGNVLEMIRLALNGDSPGEGETLRRLLELTNWNRSRAAWILGVSEGTVRNRIKKHNITRS